MCALFIQKKQYAYAAMYFVQLHTVGAVRNKSLNYENVIGKLL